MGKTSEIPSDYIPEEDLWQAELSFHGTRAWSPDSLILVSFYAGFQALTKEKTNEAIMSSFTREDICRSGTTIVNPMIGALPSRQEILQELDDLLMTM